MAKKVMITGVYGLIAGAIYKHLVKSPDQYDVYGLARRRQDSERVAEGEGVDVPAEKFVLSDLTDLNVLVKAFKGMDVVVHMAADPSGQGGWESVLKSNIMGAYNTFEACRLAGVPRIVYASSIQASSGYRQEEPYKSFADGKGDVTNRPVVTHTMPTRPMNIYASSKVWGEGLARIYSDAHGMSCLCIRIGWVIKEDKPRPHGASIWCSQRDIVAINECCINAPTDLKYDIFYGMSNNKYLWVDIDHARQAIGYVPQDCAEDRI
jgi:nucleoside-diphosphate-sugar epimerase